MTILYSPSTGGFYDTRVHGERTLRVVDPDWTRPTVRVPDPHWTRPLIDVEDPDWERPSITVPDPAWMRPMKKVKHERVRRLEPDLDAEPPLVTIPNPDARRPLVSIEDASAEPPMIEQPDMSVVAPTIEVQNPACRIPADAIEISDERHLQLMEAQAAGAAIQLGDDGLPLAVPYGGPTIEELRDRARQMRSARLAKSDWTQVPDSPLSAEARAAWAAYRQELRDLGAAIDADPTNLTWPKAPGDA